MYGLSPSCYGIVYPVLHIWVLLFIYCLFWKSLSYELNTLYTVLICMSSSGLHIDMHNDILVTILSTWFSIGCCLVILHSSSFVILSVHFTFIIRLKHLFTNICNLLFIWLIVFQVSQAYNNTDFTFVMNIRILTPFDMLWSLHTGYSWTNTPFAFLILLATSSYVPPFSDTTLIRYTKYPTSSISVFSNLNFCVLDVFCLVYINT